MKRAGLLLAVPWAIGAPLGSAEVPRTVEAAARPGQPWKALPTRTLEDLSPLPVDANLDSYGGLRSRKSKATGFFRAEKIDGRWWLVDPEGGLFLAKGVASVRAGRTGGAKAALVAKFGDETGWAAQATALLRESGFNGVGAWSDTERLRAVEPPLVATRNWNFMSSYGQRRGGTRQEPGHTGYPNDCIFVFDPEFEAFADEHARALAATKDDPWLLGHFSDNELPLSRAMLTGCLTLPGSEPGQRAAWAWLRARRGPAATLDQVTEADQAAFLGFVVDRYFGIVGAAIRKYDPNHLFLGARFHGQALRLPEVWKAAGSYLDVISVNYYNAWTPDPERLAMWERESGRPVLITEWYAKGADSGLANTGGAGWLVKTQRDRGLFYQNFALALLESRVCVGWHWFKYADNDPADSQADPSNRDSNKGIVTARYEPYPELLAAMKALNERAYGLLDRFEASRPPAEKPWAMPPAPEGVVIEKDLPYLAPERTEKLDLYRPAERASGERSPAVVIIHGGGWTGGDKARRREFVTGTTLALAGYLAVSIEYSREAGRRWPTNLHDAKNAVRWLRKNAERLQVDPDHVGVIGGSAGGHLALLVAYTSGSKALEPAGPYPGISDRVQACVDMYGPTNLLTRQATSQEGTPNGQLREAGLFPDQRGESPEKWALASPVSHVTKDSPPTLIIHGTADTVVDRDQSKELAGKLAQAGVAHRLLLLPGVGHAFALQDRGVDLRAEVVAFFDQYLKPAARPASEVPRSGRRGEAAKGRP